MNTYKIARVIRKTLQQHSKSTQFEDSGCTCKQSERQQNYDRRCMLHHRYALVFNVDLESEGKRLLPGLPPWQTGRSRER